MVIYSLYITLSFSNITRENARWTCQTGATAYVTALWARYKRKAR